MKRALKLLLTLCVLMNMFLSIGYIPVLASEDKAWLYNSKYYETIAEVATAAGLNSLSEDQENPVTITLTSYAQENIVIPEHAYVILDLNGLVLSPMSEGAIITNNGKLVIQDSASTTKHYFDVDGDTGLYTLNDGTGTVVVEGACITGGEGDLGGAILNNGEMTVMGGTVVGNTAGYKGGAIYNNAGASLTMTGGTIVGNTAEEGGGIYNAGTMTFGGGAVVSNNTSTLNGGGIYCDYGLSMTIFGGTISDNAAVGCGGGIYNAYESTVTISDGTISGNTAGYDGGGIYSAYESTVTVSGGTITKNSATQYGGGIYSAYEANLIMTAGAVTENSACVYGGGLSGYSANYTLLGGSITGNYSPVGGGVMFAYDESLTLGGTIDISGNYEADASSGTLVANTEQPSNLGINLSNNKLISVNTSGTDELNNTDPIGVTCYEEASGNFTVSDGAFTNVAAGTEAKLDNFVADRDGYAVVYKEADESSGQLALCKCVCYIAEEGKTADECEKYESVAAALNAVYPTEPTAFAAEQTVIVMMADDEENIVIPENRVITLDLDGYVISGDGTASVIVNKGDLTVTDSNTDEQKHGLALPQANTVFFTLDESITSGNTCYGGVITGGNSAMGGGIYNEGNLTLLGGLIVGNICETAGGGVASAADATLTVGGVAMVVGNGLDADGNIVNNDLYLAEGQTVTVSKECPFGEKKYDGGTVVTYVKSFFGVTTEEAPVIGTPVAITGTNDDDYSSFFYDNSGEYKIINRDNVVYLSDHEHEWFYYAEGDTITAICDNEDGLAEDDCIETLTIRCDNCTYDSTAHKATLNVSTFCGEEVSEADIVYYSGNDVLEGAPTAAGCYKATITAGGETAFVEFTIAPRSVEVSGTTVADKDYDGTTDAAVTMGEIRGLVEGDDVQLTCTAVFDDANAGEGKLVSVVYTLTGGDAENYVKPNDILSSATIYPRELLITAHNKATLVGKDLEELTYTVSGLVEGEALTGAPECAADANVAGEYPITRGTLTAGDNYTITFNEGVYAVANKSIPTNAQFLMNAEDVTYDGQPHYASVFLKDGILGMGEFTVHYFADGTEVEQPTEAGTYEVRVNVTDDPDSFYFAAENVVLGSFQILPKTLTADNVSAIADQAYTGKAICPAVTVTADGKTLVEGTDYDVTYEGNVNSADAKAIVTGKGNYAGTAELSFAILCTVTFETNGGIAMDAKTVKVGTRLNSIMATELLTPLKPACDFIGWYTDTDFENAFDLSAPVSANTTLYAKWQSTSLNVNEPEGATVNQECLNVVLRQVAKEWVAGAESVKLSMVIGRTISDADWDVVSENIEADGLEAFDAKLMLEVDGEISDYGDLNDKLVQITYDFDFEGKTNVQVHRIHNGEIGELTTAANQYGEYVELNKEAGTIEVYAMKYSAFIITFDYVPEEEPTDTDPTDTDPTDAEPTEAESTEATTTTTETAPAEAPKTGDNSSVALWLSVMAICGVVLVTYKKREDEQA